PEAMHLALARWAAANPAAVCPPRFRAARHLRASGTVPLPGALAHQCPMCPPSRFLVASSTSRFYYKLDTRRLSQRLPRPSGSVRPDFLPSHLLESLRELFDTQPVAPVLRRTMQRDPLHILVVHLLRARALRVR